LGLGRGRKGPAAIVGGRKPKARSRETMGGGGGKGGWRIKDGGVRQRLQKKKEFACRNKTSGKQWVI